MQERRKQKRVSYLFKVADTLLTLIDALGKCQGGGEGGGAGILIDKKRVCFPPYVFVYSIIITLYTHSHMLAEIIITRVVFV